MTLHLGACYRCTHVLGSIDVDDCVQLLWVDVNGVQVRLHNKKVFYIPTRHFRECFEMCELCACEERRSS